jgi:hypothetical protein
MSRVRLMIGCVCLALALTQSRQVNAQMPKATYGQPTAMPATFMADAPVATPVPSTPQAPGRPPQPEAAAPGAAAPLFAEAAPAGTEASGGAYAPQMLGDSLAIFMAFRTRPVNPLNPLNQLISGSPLSGFQFTPIPIAASLSAFKIADNESPRPEDRAFLNVDYFTGVFHSLVPLGNDTHVRIAREIFGYEKTFLGGDMSIEVRVPFFQMHAIETVPAESSGQFSDFGDITLIAKFALLRDCDTGNVLCAGVAATLPTGPTFNSGLLLQGPQGGQTTVGFNHKINPTFIQPYIGFLYNAGDFYVQGFSSAAMSTDDNVSTEWFNDIGFGYWAYRGSCNCPAIIPTAELHVSTPFGHEGLARSFPVAQIDVMDVVLGVNLEWKNNTVLTFGWCFPVTGPQPFSNELIAQFNYLF